MPNRLFVRLDVLCNWFLNVTLVHCFRKNVEPPLGLVILWFLETLHRVGTPCGIDHYILVHRALVRQRVGSEGEGVWRRERNVMTAKRADTDRPGGNKSAERWLGSFSSGGRAVV